MILDWFNDTLQERKYRLLLSSLISGDVDTFSQLFQEFMLTSVSVFDVPSKESEKIYHAFILGMLIGLKDQYEVKSNRESGYGRYDLVIVPKDKKEYGIIFEFKVADRKESLEAKAKEGLDQIVNTKYDAEMKSQGVDKIIKIGLAFCGKDVAIEYEIDEDKRI